MRIFSEEEYFEMLLERASAIYSGIHRERERCARICEDLAGSDRAYALMPLLNAAAVIRDAGV